MTSPAPLTGLWLRLRHGAFVMLSTALFTIPSGQSPQASPDDRSLMQSMAGNWKGRGTVRRTAGAATEPVSCRLDSSFDEKAFKLSMAYVCLGVDVKVETRGSLTYVPADNAYRGSWHTVGAKARAKGKGRRTGKTVRLSLDGFHPETNEPMRSQLTLTLNGSKRLANTLNAVDPSSGKPFKAFSVNFRK